jgi:membrane protein DedA with SNARE-associated domain
MLRAEAWFVKYGYLFIALNRFLPGVRSVISVVAGVLQLKPYKVAILALLSGALWNLIWMLMGYTLGNNWEKVTERISDIMIRYNAAALLLLIMVGLFIFIRKRR